MGPFVACVARPRVMSPESFYNEEYLLLYELSPFYRKHKWRSMSAKSTRTFLMPGERPSLQNSVKVQENYILNCNM